MNRRRWDNMLAAALQASAPSPLLSLPLSRSQCLRALLNFSQGFQSLALLPGNLPTLTTAANYAILSAVASEQRNRETWP